MREYCAQTMLFLTLWVCIILTILPHGVSNTDNTYVIDRNLENDNFCDDIISGRDEYNTSACSFTSIKYMCTKDGITPYALPTSRIGDGICDCCDGSDEASSPFQVHCPNTCEESLTVLRRETLIHYRNIQAGLRAKVDITQRQKLQKQQNAKTLQHLVEEKEEIQKLKFQLTQFLNIEEPKETKTRWKLLHERLHACAKGQTAICEDIFASSYYSEDELRYEGFPEIYLNPKTRFVYEYSDEERLQLARSSGIERIRASICPVSMLLPDEDARIFARLSDYVQYMSSTPATQKQTQKSHRALQESTLFAQYLEKGEKGYVLLAISACETIGLLLSPVVLPVYYLYDTVWKSFTAWLPTALHTFLRTPLPVPSTYLAQLPVLYGGARCQSVPVSTTVMLEDTDMMDSENGNGMLPDGTGGGYTTTSMERQCTATYTPIAVTGMATSTTPPSLYQQVTGILLFYGQQAVQATFDLFDDSTDIGRWYYDYVGDLSRYPLVQQWYDSFRELFALPLWMAEIILRTPVLYVDYYYRQKYHTLPPRRHACLLRYGLTVANEELQRVTDMIGQEEQKLQLITRYQVQVLTGTTGEQSGGQSGGWVDVGPDQVFDSLQNTCLTVSTTANNRILIPTTPTGTLDSEGMVEAVEEEIEERGAVYDYEVCFFEGINQYRLDDMVSSGTGSRRRGQGKRYGGTSLGRFVSWHPLHHRNVANVAGGQPVQSLPLPGQWMDILHLSPDTTSLLSSTSSKGEEKGEEGKEMAAFVAQHGGDWARYASLLLQQYLDTHVLSLSPAASPASASSTSIGGAGSVSSTARSLLHSLLGTGGKQAVTAVTGKQKGGKKRGKEVDRLGMLQGLYKEWMATSQQTLQHLFLPNTSPNTSTNQSTWDSLQQQWYAFFDAKYAQYAPLQQIPQTVQQRLVQEEVWKYYSVQAYEEGTLCPVRPGFHRRAEIHLECGADLKITDIREPQTCEYVVTISTPLVCTTYLEEVTLARLEALGVFGFAKAKK